MELRSLNVFVEVVRCGSFTAAGNRLRLTQPSISRIIKQMEEEIGQPLITRNYREIRLTDAGKILYHRSLQVLREMAALDAEISDLVEVKRGVVSLGIPPLGGTVFVPFIKRFKDRHRGIELQLHEKDSKATKRALATSEIELGTLIMPVNEEIYDYVPLARTTLVLAAPLDSAWANRSVVDLGELRDESFILFPRDFGLNTSITSACRNAGFEPKIATRSSHSQLILGLVENGMGIALLPEPVVKGATNVATIPLVNPVVEWRIALAWPKSAYLSIAARAMVAMAKEEGLES